MSAVPVTKRYFSVEDYYSSENADVTGLRHEFHDGEILAMAGGTLIHSQTCANLIRELGQSLKGTPCRVFESNLRTRIESSRRNVYPDVTVVCGPPELDARDKSNGTILNPKVIIEVLSPGTERYDRTEKRDHYLQVPSLDMHVMVDQDRPRVETLTRTPDGRWVTDFAIGIDSVLKLPAISIEVPLKEIYDRVEFPPATSPPAPSDADESEEKDEANETS